MTKVVHKAEDRGYGEYGWLDTHYSFSFGEWYDPTKMGFGALRVINDDRIAPSAGFGEHSHRDMEIITIVMKGTVTHKDSMGNLGTVAAGDVQTMSAGTGVTHSEYNDSKDEPLELFQIWIESSKRGIQPEYHQQSFAFPFMEEGTILLVSPHGKGGVPINQNAYIEFVALKTGDTTVYELKDASNGVYIFVIEGEIEVADEVLHPRDAIGITDVDSVSLYSVIPSKFLIIEVPVT
jgi:redox-sensitive bicupin YhaK (pirin superfamily)